MDANQKKIRGRQRRKKTVRKRIFGESGRPRLTVFRSGKNISAQVIDDERGVTLCQASSLDKSLRGELKYGGNVAAAKSVGQTLAERAKAANVSEVRFDRNGYRYHGRIKALAESAREGGLVF